MSWNTNLDEAPEGKDLWLTVGYKDHLENRYTCRGEKEEGGRWWESSEDWGTPEPFDGADKVVLAWQHIPEPYDG